MREVDSTFFPIWIDFSLSNLCKASGQTWCEDGYSNHLRIMDILIMTLFFSMILALAFTCLFVYQSKTSAKKGMEQQSLMPLDDDTGKHKLKKKDQKNTL